MQPIEAVPDKVRADFIRDLSILMEIGKTEASPVAPTTNYESLTAEETALAKRGAENYAVLCASCHQNHGLGTPGVAPRLAGSEWVTGSPNRLAQIVLRGLIGPIKVNEETWNLHMPGIGNSGAVNDDDLAAILTFIRRSWGNTADPVTPALIASERQASEDRKFPWTATELTGTDTSSSPTANRPDAKGQFILSAKTAQLFAKRLVYRPDLDIIGPWVNESDAALWVVEVPRSGRYRVHLDHAMDDKNAGNIWRIESDDGALEGKVKSTGGFDRFVEIDAGTIDLKQGSNRILMRPMGGLKGELIDLRAIRLEPVDKN